MHQVLVVGDELREIDAAIPGGIESRRPNDQAIAVFKLGFCSWRLVVVDIALIVAVLEAPPRSAKEQCADDGDGCRNHYNLGVAFVRLGQRLAWIKLGFTGACSDDGNDSDGKKDH